MHENDVGLQHQSLRVFAIHVEVQVQVPRPERHRHALQTVVKRLRHAIELRRPADHFPVRVEAELLHHRNHPAENLGDAAASPRGVDVDDPPAFQSRRQMTQAARSPVADDLFVAVQQSHPRTSVPAAIITALGSDKCCRKMFDELAAQLVEVQEIEIHGTQLLDECRIRAVPLQPVGKVVGAARRATSRLVDVIEERAAAAAGAWPRRARPASRNARRCRRR